MSRAWITAAPMSSSILVTVARGINNGFIILRYVIFAFVTNTGLINIKSYFLASKLSFFYFSSGFIYIKLGFSCLLI